MKSVAKLIILTTALGLSACASQPRPDAGANRVALAKSYLITFRNFETRDVLRAVDDLAAYGVIGDHEGGFVHRQNYTSALSTVELERTILASLQAAGFGQAEIRVTVRDGRLVDVDRIIYGRGR